MFCNCFFCGDERFSVNRMLGLEAESSIVYEDENIFVTPDIAPVAKGHYLIVTQEHINSYGSAEKKVYDSLKKAQEFLMTSLFKTEHVLFWEHGAVISHSAGGCIDHAHIHAVPMPDDLDIDSYLESLNFITSPKHVLYYEALRETAQNGQPYISYQIGKETGFFRCVEWLPNQFFRLMMSKYQPQEYNWKLVYKSKQSQELFRNTLEMGIHLRD